MDPIKLPPLDIWPDRDTQQSWQYREAQTPVDFTATLDGVGYAATIMLLRCGKVEWTGPATLDSDGGVTVTVPQATGYSLRGCSRIDATFQINIDAPEPGLSLVWVGPVCVQEIYA